MPRRTKHQALLMLLVAMMLVGCAGGEQPAPTTASEQSPVLAPTQPVATSEGKAATPSTMPIGTALPTVSVAATSAPSATVVPLVPSVVPTLAPPTPTRSPAATIVGPEWTVAAIGDLNQDQRLDVVAFKPSAIKPRQALPDFPMAASEIVIVQQGSAGPEIQFAANAQQIVVPNLLVAQFADGSASAAYLLQVGPGMIGIVPINANGDVTMIGAGFGWDASVAGYRPQWLASPPVPTAAGPALVGAEWQPIIQTDLNANGRRDLLAIKPGPAIAIQGGYTQSIAAAVIVEEGLLGRAELQLALDPFQLVAPGVVLASYPEQLHPAGFFATLGQPGIPLNFAPYDASGRAFTTGARIIWDANAGGYRATADSQLLPPPPELLGPEWTIAAKGDANGDGIRDVVAYKPANLSVRQPAAGYPLVASEVVIVQENRAGPYGIPEVQLAMNTRQIFAPGAVLFNYASSDPARGVAAFLLNVTPTGGEPIGFIPVNTAGLPLNDLASRVIWEPGLAAYRLRVGVAPTPIPAQQPTIGPGTPLVGPEWTILAAGDFNRDGRRDVLAYKPLAITPRVANAGLPYVAREVVVVQEGAAGTSELQLSITAGQIVVPNLVIASFNPAAAAFQIGIDSTRSGAILCIPLNTTGDPIGQQIAIAWNPARSLYLL